MYKYSYAKLDDDFANAYIFVNTRRFRFKGPDLPKFSEKTTMPLQENINPEITASQDNKSEQAP